MALDAFVYCDCLQKGIGTPPPFDPALIEIDKEGWANINLPQGQENDYLWAQMNTWAENCCTHKDRYLAVERVGNLNQMSLFFKALNALGAEHFPVLSEKIPKKSGGYMTAAECQMAQKELTLFSQKIEAGAYPLAILQNKHSHESLAVDATEGGYLSISPQKLIFLRGDGFFITDKKTGDIIFQSTEFTQDRQFDKAKKERKTVLTDKATGLTFESDDEPMGFGMQTPATELLVHTRGSHLKDFAPLINALQALFTASIQTGNHVKWL